MMIQEAEVKREKPLQRVQAAGGAELLYQHHTALGSIPGTVQTRYEPDVLAGGLGVQGPPQLH